MAPVKILVSDHGYVVTLDEHEHAGYEHALVIYDPSGHVVRDSRLDELVGIDDLKKVEATVSSRWWRYLAEPPRISGNDLTLTAVWGEALTISLADGRITRDPELFKNLKRLVQGDLTQLVRVEYERWAGTEHVRCNWRAARSRCESVDRNWKATQIRQARAVGAELRGQLDAVMSLRHLVKSPSYCAWGCTDQQELRFFFVDRGERYSYAVVVRGAEQNQAATALPFAELLRLFKFSGEGTPAK